MVVLDEFQYLADNEAGVAAVASEFKAASERRRLPRPFLLVLSAVDANRSFAENATRLLLSQSGEVRLLVETALVQEEGLRDISKYRAILRAVAGGCTERNEIAQRAGLPNDAALRDKLGRLEEHPNTDAGPHTPQEEQARPPFPVNPGTPHIPRQPVP